MWYFATSHNNLDQKMDRIYAIMVYNEVLGVMSSDVKSAKGVRMPPTILIIEDYELNMRLIEDLMIASGYHTVCAYNAEEGLELARTVHPDLILMDMRIAGPGIDGWTATRIIKSDPKMASIPVIALTAQVWDGERERAFEVGCDDYITKPFNIYDLQNRISYYLQANASS